jgi:hypothetical protein
MKTAIILFLSLISVSCFAQEIVVQDSLKNLEQLSFMKGTWTGDGWMFINKEKKEFTQTETISSKVDNTVFMVDGIGYAKENKDKVIHNAFGVISYNIEEKSITMISFSSTGGKMENPITLIGDKKLEWSFKDEKGGTIRFREDFSEDGFWIEKGDYSFDGNNWFPFFEMRLKKIIE